MSEPDPVDTVAQARDLSLKKWKRVRLYGNDLFNEIDVRCAFCMLGSSQSGKLNKCSDCVVRTRCNKIMSVMSDLHAKIDKVIDDTIIFLEEMDVSE